MSASVLIVDDHAGFRSLARKLLEAEGYLVVGEAADGVTAISAAGALQPALVLLDIQLPDRNGFEVARQLNQHCPGSQIVLISIRDARDYGHRLAQHGVRGFIPKEELSAATLSRIVADTTG